MLVIEMVSLPILLDDECIKGGIFCGVEGLLIVHIYLLNYLMVIQPHSFHYRYVTKVCVCVCTCLFIGTFFICKAHFRALITT